MTDIIDLSELNAQRVRQKINRMIELEKMIHCCEVTRRALQDIQDMDRISMTTLISRFQKKWENELARLENV